MKQQQYLMVTKSGMPVYSNGRGIYSTTDKLSFKASTLELGVHADRALQKAHAQTGLECEWVIGQMVECFDI